MPMSTRNTCLHPTRRSPPAVLSLPHRRAKATLASTTSRLAKVPSLLVRFPLSLAATSGPSNNNDMFNLQAMPAASRRHRALATPSHRPSSHLAAAA